MLAVSRLSSIDVPQSRAQSPSLLRRADWPLIQVKVPPPRRRHGSPMAKSFTAFDLTSDHLAVVFPLVLAAAPATELAAWRRFARQLVEGRPDLGAIGLRNAANYICGVLVFRVEEDLQYGRVLSIDLFVSLDLIAADEATDALLQITEAKARELKCAATRIRLTKAQKSLASRFAASGHHSEASLFCKQIGTPAPPN